MGEELLRRGVRLDRYEIRELIGKGGMGEVYRAWDSVLQRDVAVKVLTLRDPDMLRRFEREAEAIGRLDNYNVVEIHDVRLLGDHPYIVMEYLRGMSLVERMKQGRVPVEEAVEIVLGVCRGVSACHRVGIIHRDLKPANVFLAETAYYGTVVKVLDFGVSKPVQYAADDLTGPGEMVGTPRYVAPERLKGMEADELSDQHGVGLLLYTILTGAPPFRGKERKELALAILKGEHPPPSAMRPDIPAGLELVTLKAMDLERARRFPSVTALGQALLPYVRNEARELWAHYFGGEAEAVTPSSKPGRTVQMSPTTIAELVRKSRERDRMGGTLRDVVVPVARPLEETPAAAPHLLSDTKIDSSLVGRRFKPAAAAETDPALRQRRKAVAILLLAVAASLLALGTAMIASGIRRPSVEARGTGTWTTVRFDDVPVDGGTVSVGHALPQEESKAVRERDASPPGELSVPSKRPARRPARRWGPLDHGAGGKAHPW